MSNIEYVDGNEELLEEVRFLWERLREHHRQNSRRFSKRYEGINFDWRKKGIFEKLKHGSLRIDIARDADRNTNIGYCISSIGNDRIGEIDSIYVDEKYRGQFIGDTLIKKALKWMDDNKVTAKKIGVAAGNEKVLSFYSRYGFYPRSIILEQIEKNESL